MSLLFQRQQLARTLVGKGVRDQDIDVLNPNLLSAVACELVILINTRSLLIHKIMNVLAKKQKMLGPTGKFFLLRTLLRVDPKTLSYFTDTIRSCSKSKHEILRIGAKPLIKRIQNGSTIQS